MAAGRQIDVRELPAPEPLQHVLVALETFEEGEFLHVLHRREAHCLAQILDDLGFAHELRVDAPGPVHIWIWRQHDAIAELAARHEARE